jgi:hypothetical protein
MASAKREATAREARGAEGVLCVQHGRGTVGDEMFDTS